MRFRLLLTGLLFSGQAWSLQSDLPLQQLNHKSYTVASGTPSYVSVMTQTPDGMLWVGSDIGLFRFDGVQFVRYNGPPGQKGFASANISTVAALPDSGLWIGFRIGGVSVLQGDRLTSYGERDGLPAGTVWNIFKAPDGQIWVAARGGLAYRRGDRWQRVAIRPDVETESVRGALFDPAGTLWVVTAAHLFARPLHADAFREVTSFSESVRVQDLELAVAPDGKVWASVEETGLLRLDSLSDPHPTGTRVFPSVKQGALMFDHAGSLWVANDDVQRLLPHAQTFDTFTRSDGLTDVPHSVFEDREGNIWVGTSGGLDRFSDSSIVKVPLPPGADAPAIAVGEAGALWLAYATGHFAGNVAQVLGSEISSPRYAGRFNSVYRDPHGSVWFCGPQGLLHIEGARQTLIPVPERARHGETQAMTGDDSGALWISVTGAGLFRFSGGQWTENGNLTALPRSTVITMTSDKHGTLWFGYTNNRVARVSGSSVQLSGSSDGLDIGSVTAIVARDSHVWIGGELGLAHFDGKRFSTLSGPTQGAFTGISGIVATANGDLWLNGNTGILHLTRAEVDRAVRDPGYRAHPELFNYLDGLPATAHQIRPTPSALEGTDGRLWFAQVESLVWIDPTRIRRNPLPPPVTIWSVTSGGRRYLGTNPLHLPARTTSLQVQFTAGSLTIPERVAFRYRLDGSDEDWQDALNRREAFYTNLAPGHYTFRVIAANNDGVWNNTGASVELTISPTFYQTTWFALLCGFISLAVLYSLHRLRLKQARVQVRARLEERVTERERIARELHDTLLQSIQGLILRFHAITERIAPHESIREQLNRALQRADEVLAEGRDRVKDLRTAGVAVELSRSLATTGDQLAHGHSTQFEASVDGTLRDLHPIVREEALLIATEALTNAFRHAQARKVEAEVSYGSAELHVRIRDDGTGIDAAVLQAGARPGHWGLVGMRERAQKIRASLNIWSRPGTGTEIDLCVPAEVAYNMSVREERGWW